MNPLAAVQEGYDFAQGLRDRRTMNNAGNALAGGDYRGGANALLQGGMLDQGMGLLNYDQRNQEAQAKAMQQQAEAAKAQQAESMKSMLGGAQSLRQLPPAARAAAYQAQVRPLLEQMGLDGQILAHLDGSDFSDGQLDPFIATLGGELQKPEYQIITPGNGQRPYAIQKGNPGSFQYVGPEVTGPQGVWKAEGGNQWFYPADGSEPRKGPALTPTPKTFAPPRARSGGGGGGGAPPAGSRSYGSGATPQWD
jgi:hypothetical protein